VRDDLSPLRADGEVPATGRRSFRGPQARGKTAKPWAASPFFVGTFTYLNTDVHGRILVVEANLTDAIPWDVQAWAESHGKFPDDPTRDQLFDHRRFESYHALGQYQNAEGHGWDACNKDAASWVDGGAAEQTTEPVPHRLRPSAPRSPAMVPAGRGDRAVLVPPWAGG
jgi:hypothetical protein